MKAEDSTLVIKERIKKKTKRVRDIVKKIKMGTTLVIFAIENQSEIDYQMPVRVMEHILAIIEAHPDYTDEQVAVEILQSTRSPRKIVQKAQF